MTIGPETGNANLKYVEGNDVKEGKVLRDDLVASDDPAMRGRLSECTWTRSC
jgi:hypothetical protein